MKKINTMLVVVGALVLTTSVGSIYASIQHHQRRPVRVGTTTVEPVFKSVETYWNIPNGQHVSRAMYTVNLSNGRQATCSTDESVSPDQIIKHDVAAGQLSCELAIPLGVNITSVNGGVVINDEVISIGTYSITDQDDANTHTYQEVQIN